MNILNQLERKIGWIAIPGVVRVIMTFQVLVFVLIQVQVAGLEAGDTTGPTLIGLLQMDAGAVLSGQVWRLFTCLFVPPVSNLDGLLLLIIAFFFTSWLGGLLEAVWGSFRTTLYILGAMVCAVLASFFVYFVTGGSFVVPALFFYFGLLIAAGIYYPDLEILLMFVIPIKLKWLAIFATGFLALQLVLLLTGTPAMAVALLISNAHVIAVFGPGLKRAMKMRGETAVRRRRFEKAKEPENASMHECATCGKTEHDDAELEFRVSVDGEEYCDRCRNRS